MFFFEDSGSAPIQIDRPLLYLDQLTSSTRCAESSSASSPVASGTTSTAPRSKTLEEVLTGRLGDLGVPVLYNLPLGHGASLATLPLGVQATLDADSKTLTIDEPALSD
ncbi:MAG TPA: hypothetical protein VK273_11260 [Gaiellaceae bacterium]|nr:hypothetical protein [Gaiellaceae bacterium]